MLVLKKNKQIILFRVKLSFSVCLTVGVNKTTPWPKLCMDYVPRSQTNITAKLLHLSCMRRSHNLWEKIIIKHAHHQGPVITDTVFTFILTNWPIVSIVAVKHDVTPTPEAMRMTNRCQMSNTTTYWLQLVLHWENLTVYWMTSSSIWEIQSIGRT